MIAGLVIGFVLGIAAVLVYAEVDMRRHTRRPASELAARYAISDMTIEQLESEAESIADSPLVYVES